MLVPGIVANEDLGVHTLDRKGLVQAELDGIRTPAGRKLAVVCEGGILLEAANLAALRAALLANDMLNARYWSLSAELVECEKSASERAVRIEATQKCGKSEENRPSPPSFYVRRYEVVATRSTASPPFTGVSFSFP